MAAAYAGMNSLMYPTGTAAKGTVAQNAASRSSTMARASRFWPRLGGSVDSRICCSSNAPVVAGAAVRARELRATPFERSRGTSVFPPSLYRLVDEFYQCFTFEGLAEEAQGTSLHDARPQPLLRKGGHEDDRDVATLRQQRFLQFDAVQARHLQIGDDAGRMVQMRRLQELFCGCKRVGAEAERRHEAFDRTAHRLVIVDDRYDRGVLQLLVLNMGAQPRRISGWRKPSHATNIYHCGHRKNHIKVLDRCELPRPAPCAISREARGAVAAGPRIRRTARSPIHAAMLRAGGAMNSGPTGSLIVAARMRSISALARASRCQPLTSSTGSSWPGWRAPHSAVVMP